MLLALGAGRGGLRPLRRGRAAVARVWRDLAQRLAPGRGRRPCSGSGRRARGCRRLLRGARRVLVDAAAARERSAQNGARGVPAARRAVRMKVRPARHHLAGKVCAALLGVTLSAKPRHPRAVCAGRTGVQSRRVEGREEGLAAVLSFHPLRQVYELRAGAGTEGRPASECHGSRESPLRTNGPPAGPLRP